MTQMAAAGGLSMTAAAETEAQAHRGDAAKQINHILFFVHPPVTYSYHDLLRPAPEIAASCRQAMVAKASDPACAVWIVQSGKGDKPLVDTAREHFGERCIVDSNDNSEATRLLLAGDMERTYRGRSNHNTWGVYELWSANNARRWTQGFRRETKERGFTLNTENLSMETFGSWSGCHHKYSNFFPVYLGMKQPALVHAETTLCTLKGMPMEVGEFIGHVPLDRHVMLFLFRRTDGCPMAQFWDGLRPVWDRPHTATIEFDPGKVELINFSPNSYIPVEGVAKKIKNGFIADVGDGCHPAFTTVIGRGNKDPDVEAFRSAMANAVVAPRPGPPQVFYAVET